MMNTRDELMQDGVSVLPRSGHAWRTRTFSVAKMLTMPEYDTDG